jgi:Protein of unknown function (DUF2971)
MEMPKLLYKYRQNSSQAIENLASGSIWVSNPKNFNDPFDCQHAFLIDTHKKELKKLMQEFSERYPFVEPYAFKLEDKNARLNILQYFNSFIEGIKPSGVFSVSEKKNDLLMWAHYADSYKGFVIGYHCEPRMKSDGDKYLIKVSYSKKYPKFHVRDLLDDPKRCLRIMSTHKGMQWKYEEEWRLIYMRGNCVVPSPWPISEIVFGYRMGVRHIKKIRSVVLKKNRAVKFYMARPNHGAYCLDIRPY